MNNFNMMAKRHKTLCVEARLLRTSLVVIFSVHN